MTDTQSLPSVPPTVECETETPGDYPLRMRLRTHVFRADAEVASGGADTAPSGHDYFDSALAACKGLTATWYAKQKGIPLERVEVQVERDASAERAGKYVLKVRVAFHGPLSEEDQKRLHSIVARCPIHKLMTTSEVVVETEPVGAIS